MLYVAPKQKGADRLAPRLLLYVTGHSLFVWECIRCLSPLLSGQLEVIGKGAASIGPPGGPTCRRPLRIPHAQIFSVDGFQHEKERHHVP